MVAINRLTRSTAAVNGADLFAVYKSNSGGAQSHSAADILTYVQANTTAATAQTVQYSAPSATDFTVTVNSGHIWLILTPGGAYADGAIALPDAPADGDTVTVNSTQAVTALVVSSAKTVTGEPSALAANGFFTMRYDAATGAWYRIG